MFGLEDRTVDAIRAVLARHPAVVEALVFGSRASGRHTPRSDVDLALRGDLDSVEVERIALDLDDLPVAVEFDVEAESSIHHAGLKEHIARVGQSIYRRPLAAK